MKPISQQTIGPELWQRISSVFADALEVLPEEREQYLRSVCAGSEQVEQEVHRLLTEHDRAGFFLETPVLGRTTTLEQAGEPARACQDGDILAGRFHVVRLLGAGGMGEVYEVFDSELRENVAVKTLRGLGARDPAMVDRFRTEVLRSRQITHPNVGRVYDLFTHTLQVGSEVPFFTMELLRGETLSQWLAQHGPFSTVDALPLLEQMAAALHAAHRVGIVHRDFKPGNVFVSLGPGDTLDAIVTDFGIAAELGCADDPDELPTSPTGFSLLAGTPAYMAPEQLVGETSSPATDVYAFGLVAYEMVVGQPAYQGQSALASALKKLAPDDAVICEGTAIPVMWGNAIHRCLRRNPQDRFADPLDFVEALGEKCRNPPEQLLSRRFLLSRVFWLMLILTVIVSVAIAFVIDRLRPTPGSHSASIAVLPFDNLSGDSQLAYFSDGVAEEITNALTAYPKLHVASRAAAFGYSKGSPSLKKAAEVLGVDMFLMGTVNRSDNRAHIAVQLVHGATGRQIWSQIYDRDVRQVLAVEGEITREVAARLALGAAPPRVLRQPTESVEAYDLFLRGRYLWNTRTREGLTKSLDYFEQAIRLDSKFALAHTAIADTYTVLADYGWMPPLGSAPRIRSALQRSLALDPDSADTQASLGLFDALIEWDQGGAERAFQRALSLNPSLLTAHLWYGGYLMRAGRLDEALREAEEARRLDRVSLPTLVFLGWVHYYRHEYAQAIEVGKQAVELNPSFPHGHQLLALAYAASGRTNEALLSSEAAVRLTADQAVALRYRALALSLLPGHEREARQVTAQLESVTQDRQAGYLVIIYAGLRDRERMYYWADRAIQTRDSALLMANVAPALDSFRNDPRFQQVLRKVGYLQ